MNPRPGSIIDPDALKYILSLPAGRKVLWDILAVTGLYRQPRVPGDPGGTEFNCGALNVGLIIWSECQESSPDHVALLMKEQGTYDNERSIAAASGKPVEHSAAGRDDEPDTELGFDRFSGPREGFSGF